MADIYDQMNQNAIKYGWMKSPDYQMKREELQRLEE